MSRRKLTLLIAALTGWALLIAGMAGPAQAVTSARAASQCRPALTSVSSISVERTQAVTLTGTCLGTSPAQADADLSYFRITDLSTDPSWNGCHNGTGDNDTVGCAITSWTDTSITFAGYDGSYGGAWSLDRGDDVAFMVWNPQTGTGPAFCQVTVGAAGTTDCPATPPAQVALSSQAAHATEVTYLAQFKVPAAGLTGGTSRLTLTAPAGTALPGRINEAYDATAGTNLGGWGSGTVSSSGNSVTWTAGASVPGGDVLLLVIPGETNPGAVSGKLQVTTSQPSGSTDLPFTVTPVKPLASVAVAPAQPAIAGASNQYVLQFTASSTGGLVIGGGQITITAPAGTILPSTIADEYNVTGGYDIGPWYNGTISASGDQGTWTIQGGVLPGDVIDLTLDGVTNPAAGSHQLSVTTSSDTAAKSASYQVLSPGSVPRISGTISYDNGGSTAPVAGSQVQACSGTTCVTDASAADGNGDYSLYVPSAGTWTVTAFAPTTNAYSLGEGSATPAAVTVAGPNAIDVTLPPLAPLPSGVNLDGQSGTVGDVFWGSPLPLSVPGCTNGAGVGLVTAINTQTGATTMATGPLTESPAGSGTYTATIPALYPSHGTAAAQTAISCYTPSALLPTDGPGTGGNEVQLNGAGFTGATAVTFGSAKAESFTVVSDSQIDAVAPPGSGTVQVTVVTPGGTISDPVLVTYTYLTVGAVSPATGPAAGGTAVSITGSELGQAQAVYFGDIPATSVTVVSATQITATAPAGTGTVPVTVLTADGGVSAASAPLFRYAPAATASATGTGATGGQAPALAPDVAQALAALAPQAGPGTAGGQATAARPATVVGFAGKFVQNKATGYVKAQVLQLLRYTANRCAQGYQFGQAFSQALRDYDLYGPDWNQHDLQYSSDSAALQQQLKFIWYSRGAGVAQAGTILLQAFADLQAAEGDQNTDVINSAKCLYNSLPIIGNNIKNFFQSFQFHIDPSGTVEDTDGYPVTGATVTLLQSAGKLGPFTAPQAGSPIMVPSVNPEVTGPAGAFHWDVLAGYYKITAAKAGCYVPGHKSQATASTPVFPIPPPKVGIVIVLQCAGEKKAARPTVTGLSLTRGPGKGGTTVDVTGTGFTAASVVKFGAAKAAGVTVLGPTDIQVTAPRGTGTVAVTVTTSGGTSAQAAKDRYTYIPAPAVTRISPAHGPAKGETAVTITGTGFAAGDTVAFGRNAATSVTVVSSTRILAKAPAGAGTVAVTVTNVDGTSRATAASAYAYAGKPVFSSAAALTVTRGKAFSFTAVAGGYPAPALTVSGHLPPGVTFTARKGGTATLAGKPTRAGKYTVTLRARNAHGTVTKTLTITVRA